MILNGGLILLAIYAFLPKTSGNPPWSVKQFVEFNALSYEDTCEETAEAEWRFINDPTNHNLLLAWEQAQASYSSFKKQEVENIHNETNVYSDDDSVMYQLGVAEKPGDTLLNATEWKKLVSFSAKAAILRTGTNHTDGNANHSRRETEIFLSGNAKLEDKRSTWTSWHRRLTPLVETFSSTLGLVSEAAKANDAESVPNYWELLSGYTDGYDNMKNMWVEITELHKKLVTYVRNRLAQKYKTTFSDDAIPAYLLGSLDGSDWISISADVMPYGNVTYSVLKNLWEKNLRGITLYRSASMMGKSVLIQVPDADFWKKSIFNQTCSNHLVNFCRDGATRVLTCHQASLANFLDAHKVVAKVVMSQMKQDAYPVYNTANRYSGLTEGVAELLSIISVSPGQLVALELIDNSTDTEHSKISSLMITALDVLPRLAYYISADLWRIDVIKNGTFMPNELVQSWWQYRKQYEGVTTDSPDIPTFLDDEFITSNKPYLPKFLGTVLAFQLYEYLEDSTEVRYDAAAKSRVNRELVSMLQTGGADDWTRVLNSRLELDEVTASSLTSFFAPLQEYLDNNPHDIQPLTPGQEADLLRLEETYSLRDVTTTPTPSTTRATFVSKKPKPPPKTSEPSLPLPPPVITTENPSNKGKIVTTKKEDDSLNEAEVPEDGESNYTDKMSTSKAVWAVAVVLVATVTICIIAIFGRRRCVKSQTPKNRRYV